MVSTPIYPKIDYAAGARAFPVPSLFGAAAAEA